MGLEGLVDDAVGVPADYEARGQLAARAGAAAGEGVDDVFEAATRQSLLSGDRGRERSGCCVIL